MTQREQPTDSDPTQLASLMTLDGVADDLWSPDELGAILRHQLAASVSYDLMLDDAKPDEPAADAREPNASFGDALFGDRPSVELLDRIRRFAKQHHNQPSGALPAPVARVVYYASIAAAALKWDRRITRLDDAALKQGIEWALAQPWLDAQTRTLLTGGLEGIGGSERPSL